MLEDALRGIRQPSVDISRILQAETSGGITVLKGRTASAEALSDLRAAYYEKYGVSLFVGVGIPIPLLDEELAHDVSIRNEQITTNILDFGEEERPIGQTNYAELRGGSIEVRGQRVRTAPVASLRKAREIAETLKGWIARGEFLLTEPVQPMPAHSTVKGLKADDELFRSGGGGEQTEGERERSEKRLDLHGCFLS